MRTKTGREHARFCPALPALRIVSDASATLTIECHNGVQTAPEVVRAAVAAVRCDVEGFA